MKESNRRKIGGVTVAVVGVWLLRETLSWAFGEVLSWAARSFTLASMATWPWFELAGFVCIAVGLTLAFWPSSEPSLSRKLHVAADRALARQHAALNNPSRDGSDLRNANNVGESCLLTFKKAGFRIPKLPDQAPVKSLILIDYFNQIAPMLADGHVKEAKACAKEWVAKQSKD